MTSPTQCCLQAQEYRAVDAVWLRAWRAFVAAGSRAERPAALDNTTIADGGTDQRHVCSTLKMGEDYAVLPVEMWTELIGWYGGGPEIVVWPPHVGAPVQDQPAALTHSQQSISDQDHLD